MVKNKLLLLTALLTVILVISIIFFSTKPSTKTMVLPNGQTVSVEIADTSYKQTKGLMHRKSLGENDGMLFPHKRLAKHVFWMKNTLIPLDMIWLDAELKIVDITKNVPPCVTSSCPTYMPAQQALYTLEVNAGYSDKQDLKIGDTLKLE
jgi:uncharacterized membrane protein (UPF0127 family)